MYLLIYKHLWIDVDLMICVDLLRLILVNVCTWYHYKTENIFKICVVRVNVLKCRCFYNLILMRVSSSVFFLFHLFFILFLYSVNFHPHKPRYYQTEHYPWLVLFSFYSLSFVFLLLFCLSFIPFTSLLFNWRRAKAPPTPAFIANTFFAPE